MGAEPESVERRARWSPRPACGRMSLRDAACSISAAIAYVDRVTGDETNAVPDDDAPDDDAPDDGTHDGDDPSLEGSWQEVRERHGAMKPDEQRELFRRWTCQKHDDFRPSRCQ